MLLFVFVLTAGAKPAFPSDADAHLARLVEQVGRDFDFVVWDSPPLVAYPDGRSLAGLVGGTIVVIEADQTPLHHLDYVREQLSRPGARILGAVLNRSGRFLPRSFRPSEKSAG